ncbi:TIGR03960 family B12-binding radical SAM protein [Pelolinea submarina]|uniref:Radical SAM family uncharacterized protein n=1 Tax=Pelolinea submarina TaxID=913107 RepID=A0A347ZTE1_9CHLR|nr:TIGR03960 family B12-binding radical SAM protein [Pelolinea submarina]REG10853.1 radical SAM family uncharacterized protein [Pelolinea submarina]BBB48572.1 hypothetical protein Pelsub_P1800 [Pelolinea submarina]
MTDKELIQAFLDRYLLTISKPGRYTGGEFNQITKNWEQTELHFAFAFPDVYDIGLPNLGMSILYDQVNRRDDALAERVYAPWEDMEVLMRSHSIPLFSLESKQPLKKFDVVGFTLPYETLYTNLLNMLDLSGIPLRSGERSNDDPLILAGGHACFNPEPMHAFIDAFVIGEGEEIIHEIAEVVKAHKQAAAPRLDLLKALDDLPGIYVPSFYAVSYAEDGLIKEIHHIHKPEKTFVQKRIVKKLPKPVTNFLVPNVKAVNERAVIEIMRGCSRGCRFCQAGMITRPVRERPASEILEALEQSIESTGYEEVSLLSLSSSDHSQIAELIPQVMRMSESRNVTFSLPSLRVESFGPELIASMAGKRKGNFTIAPEAGSDVMRTRINKSIDGEDILATATQIFKMGWTNLKLYFMIGFPDETLEDIEGIVDLTRQIRSIGKRLVGGRVKIHISVNTLIPKAHTAFQWLGFSEKESILEKYRLIQSGLKNTGIKLDWPDYDNSMLEVWLSRGDRRLSDVIEAAWRGGARFDAWHEYYDVDIWQNAFGSNNIDPTFYSTRSRCTDEILPWDHIHTGVSKKYLLSELEKSRALETTADCRQICHGCGIQANYTISCENIRTESL